MLQLRFKDASRKSLWLVEQRYSIGSGAECTLTIADRRLHSHHADLFLDGDVGMIRNLMGDSEVRVNGIPVSDSHPIAHGDVLCLGMTELNVVDPKRHTQEQEAAKRASQLEGQWVLKPMSRALGERQYVVDKTAVLGRARECDISLGVAHLSRRHARLTVTDRGLKVEDLDSANGTYVNGQRIKEAVLRPGDQLSFDAIQFQISGPQLDLDATTVRPIISVQQTKKSPGQPVPAKTTKLTPSGRSDTPIGTPVNGAREAATAANKSTSGGGAPIGVILGVVVVLAMGVAAYLFLGKG